MPQSQPPHRNGSLCPYQGLSPLPKSFSYTRPSLPGLTWTKEKGTSLSIRKHQGSWRQVSLASQTRERWADLWLPCQANPDAMPQLLSPLRILFPNSVRRKMFRMHLVLLYQIKHLVPEPRPSKGLGTEDSWILRGEYDHVRRHRLSYCPGPLALWRNHCCFKGKGRT